MTHPEPKRHSKNRKKMTRKLNLKEKLECIDFALKFNQSKAARKFDVSDSAVNKLLKNKVALRKTLADAKAIDVAANKKQKNILCGGTEKKETKKKRIFGHSGPQRHNVIKIWMHILKSGVHMLGIIKTCKSHPRWFCTSPKFVICRKIMG